MRERTRLVELDAFKKFAEGDAQSAGDLLKGGCARVPSRSRFAHHAPEARAASRRRHGLGYLGERRAARFYERPDAIPQFHAGRGYPGTDRFVNTRKSTNSLVIIKDTSYCVTAL